jgi:hypothetical protein
MTDKKIEDIKKEVDSTKEVLFQNVGMDSFL